MECAVFTPPFTRDQQIEFMRTAQERMTARAACGWPIRARLGASPEQGKPVGTARHSSTTIVEHVARRRCV
jgi:hypothetical protein